MENGSVLKARLYSEVNDPEENTLMIEKRKVTACHSDELEVR